MKGIIRPLAAFKNKNPEIYEAVNSFCNKNNMSAKHKENEFYWHYCFMFGSFVDSENLFPSFFFSDPGTFINKSTITEMGRLLLTGWYYNIEEFAKKTCQYIVNGYEKAEDKKINDLEFAKAVKHIRENIGYYYHHEGDLKVYLMKKFFNEEIKEYLPEPSEELKSTQNAIDFINKIEKNCIKKDKNYYRNNMYFLEERTIYLEEILDNYGIEYLQEGEHKKQYDKSCIEFRAKYSDLLNEHEKACNKNLLENVNVKFTLDTPKQQNK